MQIAKINRIKNFRNLEGVQITFNDKFNFIVGENNIGKTNVLQLLHILINKGKFNETDFFDVTKAIEIEFCIKLSKNEIGYFEDNFDIDDELKITILAKQDSVDERIEFQHTPSEVPIDSRKIRALNFIYYSSLRNPNKELNFTNNIGTGKVLNYLVDNALNKQKIDEKNLIKIENVKKLIEDLNIQIKMLNGLSKENIVAYVNSDGKKLISRILEIGDETGKNLNKLGDGIQYAFNIFLYILDLFVHLKTTMKEEKYEDLMIRLEDDKKYMPLFIGLDEPEIHQHPYRQRALIKCIRKIIDNRNKEFINLIKSLFDIDGIIGQVFVVTHSPNILLDNYKEIIRLYNRNGIIKAISGMDIHFEPKVHKHLLRSFIYIKEAMFSKSVILVEGDTEYGAIPEFTRRLEYDIDEESVGIIKLDGADSIIRCLKLYKAFQILAKAIIDKDKKNSYENIEDVYFTGEKDFEEEVYSMFSFNNYLKYLDEKNQLDSIISILKKEIPQFDVKNFLSQKSKYEITKNKGDKIMDLIKKKELKKLREEKNAINGALLAQYVDDVPLSFKKIIKDSVQEF